MNTLIPKITQAHYAKAWDFPMGATVPTAVDICNKAIEIALAEANEQPLISADEARKLGAGNAEYQSHTGEWIKLDPDFYRKSNIAEHLLQYRAIQPQAEPKVRLTIEGEQPQEVTQAEAQAIWERLKPTHAVYYCSNCTSGFVYLSRPTILATHPSANAKYELRLKPTVKLTIDGEAKMFTPAQCEAERVKRIDTHDVECSTKPVPKFEVLKSLPRWEEFDDEFQCQYKLIRKQKVEMWCVNGVPIVPVGDDSFIYNGRSVASDDAGKIESAIEALVTKEFV